MTQHADTLRGLTLRLNNVGGTEEQAEPIELLPEARIFSMTLVALFAGEPPIGPGDSIGALKLQDSRIDLFADEFPEDNPRKCEKRFDFGVEKGLKWPASARLIAPVDCIVTLYLTYGDCARA